MPLDNVDELKAALVPISARRDMAKTKDRQFLTARAEDNPPETPRHQVLEALEASLLQYDELYRKLAQ